MEYTVYPKLIIIQIFLYFLIMVPFLSALRFKKMRINYNGSENYRRCVILLGILFSVIASYDGDWYHYIPIIRDNYLNENTHTHLEWIHIWIIRHLSFGNYLFWRLIIWGTTYWLIWLSLRRIKQNNLITWTCVMAVCLIQMSISRVALGVAFLFYGFICILRPKVKTWSVIKGILIMSLSLVFHKSMFIYMVASLFALIHYKKAILAIIICTIPIVINIFINLLFRFVLVGEVSRSAEGYLSDPTAVKGIGANLYNYTYYLIQAVVFILFYKLKSKETCNKNNYIYRLWQNNYNIFYIFIVVWGALTANNIGNNDISMRILWGLYLPTALLMSYMIKHNFRATFNILLVLGLYLIGFYRLFYAFYLQSLGTGV